MNELLHAAALWAADHVSLLPWIGGAVPLPFLLWGLIRGDRGETVEADDAVAVAAEAPSPAVEPVPAAVTPAVQPEPARVDPAVQPAPVPVEPAVEPEPAAAPEREAEVSAPAVEEAAEVAPAAAPARVSLRDRLARTSEALVGRLGALLGGSSVDADLLEELEALLFTADLGVKTAQDLLEAVRGQASGQPPARVREILRERMAEKLAAVEGDATGLLKTGSPHVVLVLGVNGSGKTTTIGKLAARYRAEGYSVILGAGDTFRAAAREQLQTWGERVGCEVIVGADGGDPAAIAFDTVAAAKARGVDVALIDTAGRLQTKAPLMEELGKIARVIAKELPDAPHETLLVLDSNTGQNAISQAREFTQAAPISGLVLTKLDGTAKGGVIIGLADEFGIPVRFVGVGEGVEDLRDFSADEFIDALFG